MNMQRLRKFKEPKWCLKRTELENLQSWIWRHLRMQQLSRQGGTGQTHKSRNQIEGVGNTHIRICINSFPRHSEKGKTNGPESRSENDFQRLRVRAEVWLQRGKRTMLWLWNIVSGLGEGLCNCIHSTDIMALNAFKGQMLSYVNFAPINLTFKKEIRHRKPQRSCDFLLETCPHSFHPGLSLHPLWHASLPVLSSLG